MFGVTLAAVLTVLTSVAASAAEPIALRDMGSFHVGGRLVEISGKPVKEITFAPGGVPAKIDPNGTYQVEQMYVQYFLPANEKGAYPLLLWHGGGLTGATYETTPDGREGWLNYFLRKGWSVYNSDAVERGRAGWAQYPDIFK
ncbi:MAG TPA: esterase, partial [Bradyrhizobium sp.]|nr:esterase [Bradyrhizobium sp.]